jgi:hypothetical protein
LQPVFRPEMSLRAGSPQAALETRRG